MSRPVRVQGVAVAVTAPALMAFTALVAIGLTGGLSPLGIEGLPDPGTSRAWGCQRCRCCAT